MKPRIQHTLLTLALLSTLSLQPTNAIAQGTAFTYQGRLNNGGSPASGTYDLTFSLFNTNTSGVPIAGPVTNNAVGVTNGLFTVLIDFGPGVFTGATNWLEIAVETNGGNTFTTLAPRQQLTPTPYAIYAESASDLSGTFSASRLTSLGNANGGSGNFFVGPSGNATMSGWYNTANGNGALSFNTSGSYNTANGNGALYNNTSGSDNTANGAVALSYNNGSYNTANGFAALYNNTSGSYNIALGYQAGYNFTGSESGNIDIGNPGVTGDNNVIRIGDGQSQTFIAGVINGNGAGLTGLNASQLTSIGNTNGSNLYNFFVGPSGNSTMSGWQNTANGVTALQSNTSGYGNTANGFAALLDNTSGQFNTANGVNALHYNTNGNYNTANGGDALVYNTSGNYNTANGGDALVYNTSGSWNTANGFQALFSNTSGWFNTANGDNALLYNTSGNNNTANGFEALYSNTSGSLNTASGNNALLSNTTGSYNTADGNWALYSNTSGYGNTASGSGALYRNTGGSNNIALGYQAGYNITTGSSNIDIGNAGLSTDTNIIRIGTGQSQTFIAGFINGNGAGLTSLNASNLTGVIPPAQMPATVLTNNETGVTLSGTFSGNGGGLTSLDASQLTSIGNTNGGGGNFFVGASGNATNSGSGNTANGYGALNSNTSGSVNTANGYMALLFNTSGSCNTANGYGTLVLNTIGSCNTANGIEALWNNTNGSFNTADGYGALLASTSGSNNIALGCLAGLNITTGSSNIVIGNEGLSTDNNIIRIGSSQSQTFIAGVINGNGGGLTSLNASQLTSLGNANGGYGNFLVGPSGNATMSGSYNTANGSGAFSFNMSGWYNTANGNGALHNNTNGWFNTANGAGALGDNTSGYNNTADGFGALYNNTSGNNNTANGYEALGNNTSGSYNVALGYQAGQNITTGSSNIDIGNAGLSTDTNIIRIGTTQTATYLAGTVYANGVALTSDRNAKENFTAVNARAVLTKVASLPVTEWNYKTDSKEVQHIGPMAQDFQAAFQLGADDKHISVVDVAGVALAAIQGLDQKLNEKDAEIQNLERKLDELQAVVKQLAAQK